MPAREQIRSQRRLMMSSRFQRTQLSRQATSLVDFLHEQVDQTDWEWTLCHTQTHTFRIQRSIFAGINKTTPSALPETLVLPQTINLRSHIDLHTYMPAAHLITAWSWLYFLSMSSGCRDCTVWAKKNWTVFVSWYLHQLMVERCMICPNFVQKKYKTCIPVHLNILCIACINPHYTWSLTNRINFTKLLNWAYSESNINTIQQQ